MKKKGTPSLRRGKSLTDPGGETVPDNQKKKEKKPAGEGGGFQLLERKQAGKEVTGHGRRDP